MLKTNWPYFLERYNGQSLVVQNKMKYLCVGIFYTYPVMLCVFFFRIFVEKAPIYLILGDMNIVLTLTLSLIFIKKDAAGDGS